jgi:hypothetical protein
MINKDKTLDLRGIWGTWGMIDPRLASINLANMVKGCKRNMVATTIHQVPRVCFGCGDLFTRLLSHRLKGAMMIGWPRHQVLLFLSAK